MESEIDIVGVDGLRHRDLKNLVLKLARDNYKNLGTFIRLIDYRVVEA